MYARTFVQQRINVHFYREFPLSSALPEIHDVLYEVFYILHLVRDALGDSLEQDGFVCVILADIRDANYVRDGLEGRLIIRLWF